MEEYAQHLKLVVRKPRDNKLYANEKENDLVQLELEFLGHVIISDWIKPDMKRWKKFGSLSSHLGISNYYKKYIRDFSIFTKILVEL
jgi:hypothetical protein